VIRQSDNVRVTKRCYKPTIYMKDENSYVKKPTCEYLVDGKCVLTVCVRREDENIIRSKGIKDKIKTGSRRQ